MSNVKKIRHSTSTSPKRTDEDVEPIRLSKFSGGYQPDPSLPAKIESLDWPSPPYPAAVSELHSRSRSTSTRKLASSVKYTATDADDEENPTNQPYKIHYRNKVYDDDYNDYTLKFRMHYKDANHAVNTSMMADDTDGERENLVTKKSKLQRDLEELNKLETKSGMAKLFGIELKVTALVAPCSSHLSRSLTRLYLTKAQEKLILKALDPWKASRTPSASIEPIQKTRYETPVNACNAPFESSHSVPHPRL